MCDEEAEQDASSQLQLDTEFVGVDKSNSSLIDLKLFNLNGVKFGY